MENKQDRLVVMNDIARQVVSSRRGIHETHVFTDRGNPVTPMLNSGWKRARSPSSKKDKKRCPVRTQSRAPSGQRLGAAPLWLSVAMASAWCGWPAHLFAQLRMSPLNAAVSLNGLANALSVCAG